MVGSLPTGHSNACLLVWSDCRCQPQHMVCRSIHLLSQHRTRKFHGGMQPRTTGEDRSYSIFWWQSFHPRNLLGLQNQSDELRCQICGRQINSCNFHVFQSSAVELTRCIHSSTIDLTLLVKFASSSSPSFHELYVCWYWENNGNGCQFSISAWLHACTFHFSCRCLCLLYPGYLCALCLGYMILARN